MPLWTHFLNVVTVGSHIVEGTSLLPPLNKSTPSRWVGHCWLMSSSALDFLSSVIYSMKKAWVPGSSIHSTSSKGNGSHAGSGKMSGTWLSSAWCCTIRALQVARKCVVSSTPDLQSLHVETPVGPPSLLTLNPVASLSRPWQPRRSFTLQVDLAVSCSMLALWVTFHCGAGALGLGQEVKVSFAFSFLDTV